MLGLLVLAALPAQAAGPPTASSRLVRVVSPSMDGLARDGRIRVRLRLAPGVRAFRATLAGTSVSRHFRSGRGGRTRVATLRRSQVRGLRHGVNYLYVRASRGGKRDVDAVRFVLGRRSKGFLTTPLGRRTIGSSRKRVSLRLRRASGVVRATLNGRRIRTLAPSRGRSHSMMLDGDQRLRHGRNRLVLVAYHPRTGAYDVERSTIVMRRTRPIPSVGQRRRIGPRQAVKLDARRSRAGRRGGRLTYRWRVVGAPRGAKPRLARASSARPVLKTAEAGRYRVRLTVTEHRRGRASARASQLASASDILPVVVRPDDPIGVPIETLSGTPAQAWTTVGDTTYKAADGNPLQLLVLDPELLLPSQQGSYSGTEAGTAQLLADVKAASAGSIVIIAAPQFGTAPASSGQPRSDLDAALAAIGAPALRQAPSSPEAVSAVGIAGADSGGTVNEGLAGGSPGAADRNQGAIKGYLSLDSLGAKFRFVPADYVPVNTSAPGTSAGRAAISVGHTTYTSQSVPAPGGFFVLVLDAGTLALRDQGTFPLGPSGAAGNTASLESMHVLLDRYSANPAALVFIQSIGSVNRDDAAAGGAWNTVAQDVQDLGSHRYLFLPLDGAGNDTFAFAGLGGKDTSQYGCCPTPDSKTASNVATRTPGTLAGVLGRNERAQFSPATLGPPGAAGGGQALGAQLSPVVYQPGTAWPMRDGRPCMPGGPPVCGHAAALACITAGIAASAKISIASPIQRNYWVPDPANGLLSLLKSNLAVVTFGKAPPGVKQCDPQRGQAARYTRAEFDAVHEQLNVEFGYVGLVRDLVVGLQAPFQVDTAGSALTILDAAQEVKSAVTVVPPSAPASIDTDALTVDIFDFLSYLPVPGASNLAGLMAEGLATFDVLTANPVTGGPAVPPDIDTPADGLALELAQSYGSAADNFERIGQVLTSDWGKLRTAATNSAPSGVWAFPPDSSGAQARNALGLTAQKSAFEALFPLGYSLYWLDPSGRKGRVQYPADYGCKNWYTYTSDGQQENTPTPYVPFESVANFGDVFPVVSAGPQSQLWAFGNDNTSFVSDGSVNPTGGRAPPAALIDAMFVNPTAGLSAPPLSPLPFSIDAYANGKQFYRVSTYETEGYRGEPPLGFKVTLDSQCAANPGPAGL